MLTVDLYPYQEPALDMFAARGNLLLAMDMGTGKTITSLGIAEHLLGEGEITTVLIVAPSGLLTQWARSIADYTDVTTRLARSRGEVIALPEDRWCVVAAGTPAKKRSILDRIRADPPQYVLASYDTAADNIRLFERLAQLVIIDEATVLKGFRARRAKRLRSLASKFRLALTGTPVENHRPEEAWAVMRWVDPHLFGPYAEFEAAHIRRHPWGQPESYVDLHIMHHKLATAMYRVRATDPEVAPYMPSVTEEIWRVSLDAATRAVYEHVMRDLAAELATAPTSAVWDVDAYYGGHDDSGAVGRVAAIHRVARMLLDHPELVRLSARTFVHGKKSGQKGGSAYAAELVESGHLDGLGSTPKLDDLQRRVIEVLRSDQKSKLVIVSEYLGMQGLIEQRFDGMYACERYHGALSAAEKAAAVVRFETDPDIRILLMSHAGAYGVDLPAANLLVTYDVARSSGQDRQIAARHVRASSRHRRVRVARMITTSTVEERDHALLTHKHTVAGAITDGNETNEQGVIKNAVQSLTSHIASTLGTSRAA